jgi:hypothetical protein
MTGRFSAIIMRMRRSIAQHHKHAQRFDNFKEQLRVLRQAEKDTIVTDAVRLESVAAEINVPQASTRRLLSALHRPFHSWGRRIMLNALNRAELTAIRHRTVAASRPPVRRDRERQAR